MQTATSWRLMAVLGAALAWASFAEAAAAASTAAKPSFVFILADDLGYGDVRCNNPAGKIATPQIDRIAAGGMRFTDAHSGSAVCTPTRYGIVTGRYSWRSTLQKGVLDGFSPPLIPPARATVASLLKPAGYHSACIGKWHLGWNWTKNGQEVDYGAPVTGGPDANGFDDYFAHCGSLDMSPYVYVENGRPTAKPDRETGQQVEYGWWRKGPTGADFRHEQVLPEFTRRGADYNRARAKSGRPFLLYLPLPAPHTPILPLDDFKGKSGLNPYADFVMQVDHSVGEILTALDEAGVAKDTVVFFSSDNGCSPQANFEVLRGKGHDSSAGFRGTKADIFEGGHRVPFLVRWPDRIPAGAVCAETIALVDFVATCAELAGVELPAEAAVDSVSLAGLLQGKVQGPVHEAVVHHSVNGTFAIRQGPWKLIFAPDSGGWSAPKPNSKEAKNLPPLQLYNLAQDPAESRNVQAENPEIVAKLTDLMAKYIQDGRSTPGPKQKNDAEVQWRR